MVGIAMHVEDDILITLMGPVNLSAEAPRSPMKLKRWWQRKAFFNFKLPTVSHLLIFCPKSRTVCTYRKEKAPVPGFRAFILISQSNHNTKTKSKISRLLSKAVSENLLSGLSAFQVNHFANFKWWKMPQK
jgi:hypothetical protein